ncbi:SOS response-associated peptidase [Arenibaculum pallidiluteum]|uniref:SOS response-associated peptidase n=1 Tax=Arenibaculum pallidiluteum TaxID=2812559 RepID=UPI001A95D7BE|nr:SOS response-associated peptidase [Arenibaculum pallidiluteum]
MSKLTAELLRRSGVPEEKVRALLQAFGGSAMMPLYSAANEIIRDMRGQPFAEFRIGPPRNFGVEAAPANLGYGPGMCGRYTIHSSPSLIAERFGVTGSLPNFEPRYNAAPLQQLPVIRFNSETKERRLDLLRWGLVPSWAKDPTIDSRMINARQETVRTSGAFKTAFAKRRCLVPTDAFYEWKKLDAKTKQPYAIAMADQSLFAFAGLWEGWKNPATQLWEHTYTIITGEPNAVAAPIHDRMPAILPPDAWGQWLGEEEASPDELAALLKPYPAEAMTAWPVHRDVGNVRNDRPDLIERLNSA